MSLKQALFGRTEYHDHDVLIVGQDCWPTEMVISDWAFFRHNGPLPCLWHRFWIYVLTGWKYQTTGVWPDIEHTEP
ncbi:MAG TPA: hypothetical protein VM537_35895 [Anaerolineae bacterium]|nr:hypothetical protein [Anaerolineae bacterium]